MEAGGSPQVQGQPELHKKLFYKNKQTGTEEMTQKLRAVVIHAKDLAVIASTYVVASQPFTSVPRDLTLFFPRQAPETHVIHIHTLWENTHTYK